VGDTLTVQIVEKVSATQKSTSTIDKTGKVSSSLTAAPFLPPRLFSRAGATGDSSNTFEGKGSTENTNDFSGVITATVTGVLPNGHLLVSGEKQIGVNENRIKEVASVQGVRRQPAGRLRPGGRPGRHRRPDHASALHQWRRA
jgi:flagellar basal body L-ring protein FlgH